MSSLESLFVTRLWRTELKLPAGTREEIEAVCFSLAEDDDIGIKWCEDNGYPGYTSYSSLNDLAWRYTIFKTLQKKIETEAAKFALDLDFDLGGRKLVVDSLWVNILPPGGIHTSHIHPHSVLSGTYYVTVPEGAAAIKFEDPRLGFMMMAPPRLKSGKRDQQPFVFIRPEEGTMLLWESWLRHEVPMNGAESERVSVSFNLSLR